MKRCPLCNSESDPGSPYRPFCSARCKDVDLGRWLNEEYRISRPLTPSDVDAERANLGELASGNLDAEGDGLELPIVFGGPMPRG